MKTELKAFPPLVDIGSSANWQLYGHQATTEIATRNNEIIADLATQYIELGDHIYGVPFMTGKDVEQ